MDGLLKKIESKNVKVGVIGMGYVGLPLAIEIAKSDIEVTAIDIDEVKVNAINSGTSYVPDISSSLLNEQVQKKCCRSHIYYSEIWSRYSKRVHVI